MSNISFAKTKIFPYLKVDNKNVCHIHKLAALVNFNLRGGD